MKKICFFFIAAVLSAGCLLAETPNIKFVNTGKMFIGGSILSVADGKNTIALYVPDDVRMLDTMGNVPRIVMCSTPTATGDGGLWFVGGNFYQDSESNVFVRKNGYDYDLPWTGGAVVFYGTKGEKHYIKPLSKEATFDRSLSYVDFGGIGILTNDTVVIPAKMGVDAVWVMNADESTYPNGRFLLESKEIGGKVYDASLRFNKDFPGASADVTTLGAVIVEKWVKTYRGGEQLFGFATPFNGTQKSGYFAGNWVRKPQYDGNKHTQYVYGNKPSGTGSIIALDQYVIDPNIKLEPGQPYIIKPRPANFNYDSLKNDGGLAITGASASAYEKDKFVFNGGVYTLPGYKEQLFAEANLPAYKLTSAPTGTVNWLMGNSYTSAISVEAIVDSIMASDIKFSRSMYVLPQGSQTYQPVQLVSDPGDVLLYEATEIPAMSIFMLRLNKTQPAGAIGKEFKLGKSALVHSSLAYNQYHHAPGKKNAPSRSGLNDQVIFRVTTDDNENNFDLAAIGLRSTSNIGSDANDMSKVYMSEHAGFQLYTLTAPDANNNQSKLSCNGVPMDIEQVAMNIKPMAYEPKTMVLSVRGVETLSSEDFWLEDLKTGAKHRFYNGEPYVFSTNPEDAHERFIVHFKVPAAPTTPTGIDENFASKLNMYAIGKEIFVENLLTGDIGSDAAIYDIAGKLLDTFKVTDAPKMSYTANGLISGTYIVRLHRVNSVETMKLIIR